MRGYTQRKANIYDNGNNNFRSERFARSIILQIPSQRFRKKSVCHETSRRSMFDKFDDF